MCKRNLYKQSVLLLLTFSLGMGSLIAQTQEQIEQFNKERKAFFTEKLELTDAEGKAFWPLYEDFANRKMKLDEDERNTYKYAHKNADNLSDKEIRETLAKTFRLKEEQLALEKDFYQNKFMKALPASKVMKLGKVEWDFRRHLMRKLRESRDNQGSSRGGGSRSGSGSVSSPDAGGLGSNGQGPHAQGNDHIGRPPSR